MLWDAFLFKEYGINPLGGQVARRLPSWPAQLGKRGVRVGEGLFSLCWSLSPVVIWHSTVPCVRDGGRSLYCSPIRASTFQGINLCWTYCSPKELKSLKALLFWCGGQWAEVQAELITAEASSGVPLPPRSENSFEERMRRGNHRAAFQMLSWLS